MNMHLDAISFSPEQSIALALRMPFGRVATAAENALLDRDIDAVVRIKLASIRILETAYTATFTIEHNEYAAQYKEAREVSIALTRPTLQAAFAALTPSAIATAIAEQSKAVAIMTKIGVVEASKVASGLVSNRAGAFQ
ncbi:hypothetical protein LHFGNBLO_001359 [Mesorhizobium sp. AR10]|uniref:hypothetical protein n=1 Tax=Mesorhizobium sp. AR10 TaxID=2865839 RepID=UPI00215DF680|nr:hypothetical protein [Mesorhizobium sp. AR10]UVK39944.1 hypothetical protein LHFGNBLO_001359 [Mesorhizobium sp. AR10]